MSAAVHTNQPLVTLQELQRLPSFDAVKRPARYWPCDLLSAFMLQMAARGRAVNSSMMLGSRDYAMDQLTFARTLGDPALASLAAQMASYFDDAPVHAVTVLTGVSMAH